MLDNTGTRQLAYVAKIGWVRPIEGADNIELVGVLGWSCIAKKGEFKENDLCVYFEIDSKLPEAEWSEFLASKHYKVKTYKLNKFKVISQGLALPATAFGGICYQDGDGQMYLHFDKNSYFNKIIDYAEGDFLTKDLNVIYASDDDNKRKAKVNPDARINAALARHPHIAKKWGKTIKKYKWLRKLFILLFGRKRDVRNWPAEVKKTDEERIENRPWTLEDSSKKWIATEKIDGTSTTFHLRRKKGLKKEEYFVCSRNVVFDTPNKACYYDTNVYLEMSDKYNMREALHKLLDNRPSAEWVTVQAETFGANIQKRDYGKKDHDMKAFNLIYSDCGRLGTIEMKKELDIIGIPTVPIIETEYTLPNTIDELREFVHSQKSVIDGGMREGIVFRSQDGSDSFKCVDPAFLLKYHS